MKSEDKYKKACSLTIDLIVVWDALKGNQDAALALLRLLAQASVCDPCECPECCALRDGNERELFKRLGVNYDPPKPIRFREEVCTRTRVIREAVQKH